MQPLLPEKESRNGTVATGHAQGDAATRERPDIPLIGAFRYPSSFVDAARLAATPGKLHVRLSPS